MGGDGRWWRDEIGLFRGRVALAEVDLDVYARGIAEGRFGDPGEQEVGGLGREAGH